MGGERLDSAAARLKERRCRLSVLLPCFACSYPAWRLLAERYRTTERQRRDQRGSRKKPPVAAIDFVHQSGFVERPLLAAEITGSGAALADFDGDGDLDAYIVQSGSLYPLGDPRRLPVTGNRLYFNRGDGYFDAAPDANGAADTGYGMGVAAGDFDNDGDVDLYVTNVGANVLLRNNGEGRFRGCHRPLPVSGIRAGAPVLVSSRFRRRRRSRSVRRQLHQLDVGRSSSNATSATR